MLTKMKTIADHWGTIKYVQDKKTRWWQFPAILRHINARVCGRPVEGFSQGLIELLKEKGGHERYDSGIAVACGSGQKEMNLIRQGIVNRFFLFDLSQERVRQGKELAQKYGIAERVCFMDENPLHSLPPGSVDFVHWNNALHHMFDAEEAVHQSRWLLRPGGVFLMDDFIGPNRFQWKDECLEVATWLRRQLPPHYLQHPSEPGQVLPTAISRPDPSALMSIDPSEAADSEKILPSVYKVFRDAEIRMTGGIIYHLALNDVLANMDEERDRELLEMMLDLDEKCSDMGWNHYAVALAFA